MKKGSIKKGKRTIQARYATVTVTVDKEVMQYILFIDAHRHYKDGTTERILPIQVSVSELEQGKMREIVWGILEQNNLFEVDTLNKISVFLAGDGEQHDSITAEGLVSAMRGKGIRVSIEGELKSTIHELPYCDVSSCLLPR